MATTYHQRTQWQLEKPLQSDGLKRTFCRLVVIIPLSPFLWPYREEKFRRESSALIESQYFLEKTWERALLSLPFALKRFPWYKTISLFQKNRRKEGCSTRRYRRSKCHLWSRGKNFHIKRDVQVVVVSCFSFFFFFLVPRILTHTHGLIYLYIYIFMMCGSGAWVS